jgi:thymidylate kinase
MDAARTAGWVSLDAVLTHLGYPGRGRWAVVASRKVLARADIQSGSAPDPVRSVLDRATRADRVGLREALELRHTIRTDRGNSVAPVRTLAEAAEVESALGGTELRAWLDPTGKAPPAPTRPDRLTSIRRPLRPRLRIGLSGVDGAGKSSLVNALRNALGNCGISCSVVWTRPGMRLRFLESLAHVAKRLLGVENGGLADLASGARPAEVRSRRGALGWMWSVLVTLAYLWDVRKRSVRAAEVVIYDRHLLDAIATTEALYDGVDTRLQVWLIGRLTPRADVSLWLDVPADEAARRKPDELFNLRLVEHQLDRYRANAPTIEGLVRIDGTASPGKVALSAFNAVSAASADQPVGRWARLVAWIRSRR